MLRHNPARQYREYTERLVRQTMRDFEIEGDLLEDGEREAFVAALERVAAAGNAPASSTFQVSAGRLLGARPHIVPPPFPNLTGVALLVP